jgi:eukaryotic-like serine/threonine-protein kinase
MSDEASHPSRSRNRRSVGKDEWVGRYQLIELLGVGGMAEVYKARSRGPSGFERTVVIKRIHPDYGNDPDFVAMFVAEARILGLVHHANVVQAYDFGEADGSLFLVLEFVDGPSLVRLMRRLYETNRRLPPAIAAYFANEVCRALDYVHSLRDGDGTPLKVIHRDVTPSNIVLTSTGGLKLLDFGVAKYGTSHVTTRHRTLKGKPAYLAPEALEGKPIDARVDIFSLGVVLHELLTLTSLFAGDDDLITIRKVLTMPIEPPSRFRPDISPDLDAVVMKALAREVDQRYQTAGEMAHDLNQILLAARLDMKEVIEFTRQVMDTGGTPPAKPIAPAPRLSSENPMSSWTPQNTERPTVGGKLTKRSPMSWLGSFLFGTRRDDD